MKGIKELTFNITDPCYRMKLLSLYLQNGSMVTGQHAPKNAVKVSSFSFYNRILFQLQRVRDVLFSSYVSPKGHQLMERLSQTTTTF